MKGRLSSPRFRRRLLWIAGGLGLAGIAVGGAIVVGNTGQSNATPVVDQPALVYHEPPHMRLTGSDRQQLIATATRFIKTAVARKHLDSAWQMLGPEMRAGQTRKSWDTGFNNVIPFPAVGIATWSVLYAYRDDVAMDIGVVGARNSDWAGKTFTIEFKRYKGHQHSWLVASWVPKGIGGARQVRSIAQLPPPKLAKAPLSAKWLLAPLSAFALLIMSMIGFALRSTVNSRRAAKRYAKALRYSSTSSQS